MIYLVDTHNRSLFHGDLSAMHRHRKATFIDGLGWTLPARDGQEIDAYDTDHTLYLLAHSANATLLASSRLLPTAGPHLMGDLFQHLCPQGAPSGHDVWEASRFCACPSLPRRQRVALLWPMFCAILETALLHDIAHIIFTANRALLPLALECGWRAQRLGPTLADGRDTMTAVGVEVDHTGLRTLRRRFNVPSPVTRFTHPLRLAA